MRTDDPAARASRPCAALDRLAVHGIEALGHHGVLDFERRDGQVFLVDLVLGLDTRPAARSDDLQDTVDYGSLVAAVKNAVETDPVDLIETLAAAYRRPVSHRQPCAMDGSDRAQAGRPYRGDVLGRHPDDYLGADRD